MYADKQQAYGQIGNQTAWGMQAAANLGVPSDSPRAPELMEQADRLEKALCFTEDSLNELFRRLDGVVRPAPPEPQSAGGAQLTAVGPCTLYGVRMQEYGRRAGQIGERIQDLMRRLEV